MKSRSPRTYFQFSYREIIFRAIPFGVLLLVVGLFGNSDVEAITLHATDDSHINLQAANQTNGNRVNLSVRNVGGGGERHAFVRFDLSPIPATSTIEKVTLRLFTDRVQNPGAFTVHTVLGPWVESSLSANTAPALGPTLLTVPVVTGEKQFISVDIPTNVVEDWVDGSVQNHGLALVPDSNDPIRVDWDSKETLGTSHPLELEVVLRSVGPDFQAQIDALNAALTTVSQNLDVLTNLISVAPSGDATIAATGNLVLDAGANKEVMIEKKAMLMGDAKVMGTTELEGDAMMMQKATVMGDTQLEGNAMLMSDAMVMGNTMMEGQATVMGEALLEGDTMMMQDAMIKGDTMMEGQATVMGEALLEGDTMMMKDAMVMGDAMLEQETNVEGSLIIKTATASVDANGLLVPDNGPTLSSSALILRNSQSAGVIAGHGGLAAIPQAVDGTVLDLRYVAEQGAPPVIDVGNCVSGGSCGVLNIILKSNSSFYELEDGESLSLRSDGNGFWRELARSNKHVEVFTATSDEIIVDALETQATDANCVTSNGGRADSVLLVGSVILTPLPEGGPSDADLEILEQETANDTVAPGVETDRFFVQVRNNGTSDPGKFQITLRCLAL